VGEYLAAVVDATLGSGVAAQVEAFRSGFNEVWAELFPVPIPVPIPIWFSSRSFGFQSRKAQ